jgi:subtilase family serine protease
MTTTTVKFCPLSIVFILSLVFVQQMRGQTYCPSKSAEPWQEWISRVQFNNVRGESIDISSDKQQYADFTTAVVNATRGRDYPLSITPGVSWAGRLPNLYCRVWIDFNNNKIFEDTEKVLEGQNQELFAGRAAIPNNAVLGNVRMRVSVKSGGYPTPCEQFTQGAVADFTLNVQGGGGFNIPDFIITDISAPLTARVNEELIYSYRIKNVGGDATFAPFTFFRASSSLKNTAPNGLSFLNTVVLRDGIIPAGYDTLITFKSVLPPTVVAGNYIIEIAVDELFKVNESNENNNIATVPITIQSGTTDNRGLKITNATGPTTGEPNGQIPLSITIQNTGTLASAPDSVFLASFSRPGLNTGYYPALYGRNKVAVPSIPAGQSVVVNASFTLPAILTTSYLPYKKYIEPYLLLKSKELVLNTSTPIFPDGFNAVSYYYPISPNAVADLALSGAQINTTWNALNRNADLRLTLRNNGPNTAKNIKVTISNPLTSGSAYTGSEIDSFTIVSGPGRIVRQFDILGASREELGNTYNLWEIDELAPNTSIDVTVRGKMSGFSGVAETATFYYRDLSIRPYIQYVDARNNVASNDTLPTITYRFVPSVAPDLVISNLKVPNTAVQTGQVLNYTFDVENRGTTAVPSNFTIKSYISKDALLSADDIQNGTIPTGNYPIGFLQTNVAGASRIPTDLPVGRYYLIVKIDGDDQVTESNEGNNYIYMSDIVVTNPTTNLPDLKANRAKSSVVVNENNITLAYTLENIGTAAGRNVSYSLIVSTDSLIGDDFYTSSVGNYSIFEPGFSTENSSITFTVNPLFNLPAGNYYFIVFVDAFNTNVESDETNNIMAIPFTYQPTRGCPTKGLAPWEYWVENVKLNTINNTSTQFKDFFTLGYSNYSDISTTVAKGQSYPLSITPGLSWVGNAPNVYCRVWIDFNGNRQYEANEIVLEKTNANPLTTNVLIPNSAITGTVIMRVIIQKGAYPTACDEFEKGEVEDYTINITGGTSSGTPALKITNVTGPTSARPGDAITLNVTVTNAGTGSTVPTKLSYQQKNYFGLNLLLTNDSVTIPALAPNETRTISYPLTLKNPIYPPNAAFVGDGFAFGSLVFLDYYVYASNKILSEIGTNDTLNFKYNLSVIYPQANITLNVVPNKTILQRGEKWNATYSVKNNSNIPIKQLFVNIGTFGNLARNNIPRNFQVDSIGTRPSNSLIRTVSNSGESFTNGWEVLDLAAGETRTITFYFSKIVTVGDFNSTDTTTTTISLAFPRLNPSSNVVNTNTTIGADIPVSVVFSKLPDLTLSNLNITTPSVVQGQILNWKVDVSNIGTGNATGNFTIKAYISKDNAFSADDIQNGTIPTANYTAGLTVPQVVGASFISATIPAGQYYLILKIDDDNIIPESNEFNNILVSGSTFTVTPQGGSANDLALSIVATPSVYKQWTNNNFKISVQNTGNQAFTNVKIEFPFPVKANTGGTATPSVGTWQEYCAGGARCFTWTIPTLAANSTATLDVPLFILDAVGTLSATTRLLGSTPTDTNAANNSATVTLSPASVAPQALTRDNKEKPSQYVPLIVQKIAPNPTEGDVIVEIESIIEKDVVFSFYNGQGKRIKTEVRNVKKGQNFIPFNLNDAVDGLYIIQTSEGQGKVAPVSFLKY